MTATTYKNGFLPKNLNQEGFSILKFLALMLAILPAILLSFIIPNLANAQGPQQPRKLAKATTVDHRIFFSARAALDDPSNRIAKEFSIPKKLKPRTSFWLDVYTKYDSYDHVIHHSLYPWIVYSVVDTTRIRNSKSSHYWTRYHKAQKVVAQTKSSIRRALKRLAKRKHFRNLKGLEKKLYNKLKWVKGPRSKIFKLAARNVRTQLGQRDFFVTGLKSSRKYLSHMEAEFKRLGLPTELTRIPFVESSFNESAESKVGASGVWQIMPAIGKSYLRVNKNIDERNSPLKATKVAGHILKNNFRALKSWPLAVTSYNHGIGNLRKTMRKTRSGNLHNIIRTYKQGEFGFASANFYTSFLAALHAEKYHKEIFSEVKIENRPLKVQAITLKSRLRAKDLISFSNMNEAEFINYNLDLKRAIKKNLFVPKNHIVYLPPVAHKKLQLVGN